MPPKVAFLQKHRRHATSMPMLVMHIGRVGVRVLQRFMHVTMGMRLAGRIPGLVPMLVSLIVHVRMGMCLNVVNVLMLMTFGHMKP